MIQEVEQGPQSHTTSEELAYKIDVVDWVASPASPVVDRVMDLTTLTDVKATVMPSGLPTVAGAVITLPVLKSLTAGKSYRVEVTFTDGGNNKFEAIVFIECPF